MLSMLFETGHPWITFKDACNIRSPQQHVGVVHTSNLCTEITLNTCATKSPCATWARSILLAHMKQSDGAGARPREAQQHHPHRDAHARQRHRHQLLRGRQGARQSNLKHRPVGLGIMGFQDCLYLMRTPYASDAAVEFADERWKPSATSPTGRRPSSRGARPLLVVQGQPVGARHPAAGLAQAAARRARRRRRDRRFRGDWTGTRCARASADGMRNSNCVAIAPTATISNIIGVSASIEPEYQNIYVKSNLSGEFTVVNEHLVAELKNASQRNHAYMPYSSRSRKPSTSPTPTVVANKSMGRRWFKPVVGCSIHLSASACDPNTTVALESITANFYA